MVNSFEDLIIWQKAHKLTLTIYEITKDFPQSERFGLINQIRRAAYSIPSNIVEGHARRTQKEFLQFLSIAKGSLEELKYFLLLSKDLNYITKRKYDKIYSYCEEVSKILYGFTKSIKNLQSNNTER